MSNIARYHEMRRRAIIALGDVCVSCGSEDDLHIDHVDPRLKTAHFTDLFKSGSLRRIRKELENAQLLCRPCHSRKTAQDRKTLVMYAT